MITKMLVARRIISVDKGCGIKLRELRRSPMRDKAVMLDATENRTVSVILDLSILSALRSEKPGIKIKYRETIVCRIKGISKNIARVIAT